VSDVSVPGQLNLLTGEVEVDKASESHETWKVVWAVWEGPRSSSQVAQLTELPLGVTRSALSRLAGLEIVERVPFGARVQGRLVDGWRVTPKARAVFRQLGKTSQGEQPV